MQPITCPNCGAKISLNIKRTTCGSCGALIANNPGAILVDKDDEEYFDVPHKERLNDFNYDNWNDDENFQEDADE